MGSIEKLVWSPELELGIPSIDREHQCIVHLMNELQDALLEHGVRTNVTRTLDALAAYAQHHFAMEERLFHDFSYDGAAAHVREHRALAARVDALASAVARGESGVALEVLELLREWLRHHILEVDRQYVACFLARGLE